MFLVLLPCLMVSSLSLSYGASAPHPRLFLTPGVLEKLRAKQASGDADWLELKAEADQFLTRTVAPYQPVGCPFSRGICYAYQGSGWLKPIRILGTAYLVTGSLAYANKVIEIMDAANAPFKNTGSIEPLTLDRGYPSRTAAFGLALAFDWVYDRLDEQRKTDTVNTLNAWFDWLPSHIGNPTRRAYGNYYGGHLIGFGAAGYATEGDNPRAIEIQSYILELFNDDVPDAFETGGFAGGYATESYSYGSAQFLYILRYMQMVRDATGRDLGLTTYAGPMARALLYNLKPNRWQTSDEGDFAGDYTGVLPGFFPLMLASVLDGTTEGGWMQWLYNRLAPSPGFSIRFQTPDAFTRLLYADSRRTSLDYTRSEPTYYRSSGDEHVYARSDWTDEAVWASFAAGGAWWKGHEMRKAGHIAVQRGTDYLLVNSGQWKGPKGWGGDPKAFNLNSWRTNTLFFDDLGEYQSASLVGGQSIWGTNSILASDNGPNYVYSKADLTRAYTNGSSQRAFDRRSLLSFIRSFVFLGDNYIIVWDRVQARKPTYVKKLYWHFNPTGGVPSLDGTLAQSTIGDSKLFVKTLLPIAPLMRVAEDPVSINRDPTPITYRVEVSDSVPGTDLNALHVIAATASGVSFPATTRVEVTSGNMVGALISDATPRIALFSRNGTPVSNATYQASYSGTGRHTIVDLVPGTYSVRRDGSEIFPTLSTTPAGVLAFESPGGTTFTLAQEGTSDPREEGTSDPREGATSGPSEEGTGDPSEEATGDPSEEATGSSGGIVLQEFGGELTNLRQLMAAYKAEETALQGGTLNQWWPWCLSPWDYDQDGDSDLILTQHAYVPRGRGAGLGGRIFKSLLVETGQLTYEDSTTTLIASGRDLPIADGCPRFYDLDGNGYLDIIGFSNGTRTPSYFNDGSKLTLIPGQTMVAGYPYDVKTEYPIQMRDWNGDGQPDVVYHHKPTDGFREMRWNPSTQRFDTPIVPTTSYIPPVLPPDVQAFVGEQLAAGDPWIWYYEYDLDQDGLEDDIYLSGFRSYSGPSKWSRLLIRQPDGTLADETVARGLPLDSYVHLIKDIDGDGYLDFILSRGATPGLYMNDGDSTWTKRTNRDLEKLLSQNDPYPRYTFVADFDGDGDDDFLMPRRRGGLNTELYANMGGGLLTLVLSVPATWDNESCFIADMNMDSRPDIVCGTNKQYNEHDVTIWLNRSQGEPLPQTLTPSPPPPSPDLGDEAEGAVEENTTAAGEDVIAEVAEQCAPRTVRCVDDTPGETQEFETIQAAAVRADPGDTVLVFDGTYQGFATIRGGTPSSPILFRANGTGAIISSPGNSNSRGDNINVEGTDYVIIDGFKVQDSGRAGIRVAESRGVIVRNNVVLNSRVWGIFTGFAQEVQILNNESFGAIEQHGIYVSNSRVEDDNPLVRGNLVHDNFLNGIQVNGDCFSGSDGVIAGAILEGNVVRNNGLKGFSLISMQNSVVQNNVIYNNGTQNAGAGGIHLADEPGCGNNSNNNVIVNNTIQEPRIAPIRITHGSGNVLFNNIVISERSDPIVDEFGSNTIDSLSNLESTSGTGLFANAAVGDFHLTANSSAIDRGKSSLNARDAPAVDFDGRARPQGDLYDSGAYEFASNAGTVPLINPGGVVNNASYTLASSTVAPGSIAAIFGSSLTDGTSCLPPSCSPTFGADGRLNTTMSGIQVTVNGTPAPIFYSTPRQLGIQIPVELTGGEAIIQVLVEGQHSEPATVPVEPVSPGIFTFTANGSGAGAITHVDGSPVSAQNPAHPGELVILYATGLGQVSPAVATGAQPTGVSRSIVAITVLIDGISVIPEFAGLSGCCVGLNQVNVRVPESTRPANDIPVALTIGGKQSNPVTIAVERPQVLSPGKAGCACEMPDGRPTT